MLKTRVISAAILLPVVLLLFAIGGWPYRVLIIVATLLGGVEYAQMLARSGYRLQFPILVLLMVAFGLDIVWESESLHLPWGTLSLLGASLWVLFWARRRDNQRGATEMWALLLAGGMYLGIGGGHLIALRSAPSGLWWLLTACGAVWIGDSAAYIAGTRWGRHKMAPTISPGKSWEGYAAQVLGGVVGGLFLAWLGSMLSGGTSAVALGHGLLVGGVVSLLCPAGDFLISMMKREAGVKDTGSLIPGHGGMLDRMDSILWAGILGHMLAQWLA
ncbi:MAG: phosphatidate cytidylyltransferase [Anaerolineae bacterium]|nr:phosphatidate cytidylyltransferase [Anaerolineae bacterium]